MAGLLIFVIGPVILLVSGGSIFAAGTAGYAGIAVFVGGIAARYSFVEHRQPLVQLLLNTGVATLVSGFFYLVFVLIVVL